MLGERDTYITVSKKTGFTHCDPLAWENVFHTNGENAQASAAVSQWLQRELERKDENGKKKKEEEEGVVRDERYRT